MGFVSPYSKQIVETFQEPEKRNTSMKPTLESYWLAEKIASEKIQNDSTILLKEFFTIIARSELDSTM